MTESKSTSAVYNPGTPGCPFPKVSEIRKTIHKKWTVTDTQGRSYFPVCQAKDLPLPMVAWVEKYHEPDEKNVLKGVMYWSVLPVQKRDKNSPDTAARMVHATEADHFVHLDGGRLKILTSYHFPRGTQGRVSWLNLGPYKVAKLVA